MKKHSTLAPGKRAKVTPPSGIKQKAIQFVFNTVERRFFSENLFIANRTPYTEIHRDGIMVVRHYPALKEATCQVGDRTIAVAKERHRVPLVLVPPLAATAIIFDLLPQRSVARFFLAHGFDVYLIDWGDVKASDREIGLQTFVLEWMPAAFKKIRQHSGVDELSIFAYCMGGLLSLMYTAVWQDKDIRNIITVASPVDMHQGGVAGWLLSAIHGPARKISQRLNVSLLDLPSRLFHVPGWISSLAFKMADPLGNLNSKLDLLLNMWDREYLKERYTVGQWFNDMADFPGATIKDMAVHMMINNRMSKGTLRIGDKEASFKKIQCSILAFAGDADTIVSIEAARKVLDIVSSKDKLFRIVPGGHAGLFAGSSAPDNAWAISAAWLAERSS